MTTDKLQSYCLSFPGTHEGIKWDHLVFMVKEKLFIITGFTDDSNVSFKVTPEDFEELCEREGIIQAPHLARNQWVSVTKRNALKPKEWEHYLKQSYELIKAKLPKKVREQL